MEQFYRNIWLRFACLAVASAITFSAHNAVAQQALSKSEIVTITDAENDFFDTVDQIRDHCEEIAEASPSFREAEDVAKRLAGPVPNSS